MALGKEHILKMLYSSFPDADIELQDLKGDANHYYLYIKSKKFNDISSVRQHQMVYKALGDIIGKDVHALKIKTEQM